MSGEYAWYEYSLRSWQRSQSGSKMGAYFSLGRVQYYLSRAEVVTHEIPAQSKRRMSIVKDGTIFVRRSNAYMLAQIWGWSKKWYDVLKYNLGYFQRPMLTSKVNNWSHVRGAFPLVE